MSAADRLCFIRNPLTSSAGGQLYRAATDDELSAMRHAYKTLVACVDELVTLDGFLLAHKLPVKLDELTRAAAIVSIYATAFDELLADCIARASVEKVRAARRAQGLE